MRDPARTIPRAIVVALGIVPGVYVVVGVTLLHVLGVDGLRTTVTPLATAAGPGAVEVTVRIGAAVAAFAVLLPLLAGVSRTAFAMAL